MDRLVPLWRSTRSVPSWLNGELQKVFTKRLQEKGLTLSAAEIVEALESMKIQHVSGLKKANSHVYTCGNLEVEAATARDESGEKKEASGIHVGEKQPAIPANLRLDNSFDGLEMLH